MSDTVHAEVVVSSETKSSRYQYAWELHTRIVQAVSDINRRFYDLAAWVKEIRDKELYKELGYTSLQQYLSSVGIGLSYAQLRLGARIVEGILENPEAKPVLEKLPERGVRIEEIPPSKLDDVLPAVRECIRKKEYDQAAEIIQLAQAPEKGGLSRSDLHDELVERGFKVAQERRYLCLKGVAFAKVVQTREKESLFPEYDIIIEEPRFLKGAVLDTTPILNEKLDATAVENLAELRRLVEGLQLAYINDEHESIPEIVERMEEVLDFLRGDV